MIGRLHGIVIDCPDPSGLAAFYEQLLGMVRVQDDGDWVVIGDAPDRPGLAFVPAADFQPPTWPEPEVPSRSGTRMVHSGATARPDLTSRGMTLLTRTVPVHH